MILHLILHLICTSSAPHCTSSCCTTSSPYKGEEVVQVVQVVHQA
jgi:hypothetical protein